MNNQKELAGRTHCESHHLGSCVTQNATVYVTFTVVGLLKIK